jgi:hypothetical protein
MFILKWGMSDLKSVGCTILMQHLVFSSANFCCGNLLLAISLEFLAFFALKEAKQNDITITT